MVTVSLPEGLDPFTGFTGGDRRLEVPGAAVGEVVSGVEARLPGVVGHLVGPSGDLRPHLLCLVDGTATRDLDHPVRDEVTFLTAVSGG